MKFNYKKIINDLTSLGERQLYKEVVARKLIESELERHRIPFQSETFDTEIPKFKKCTLVVDGVNIDCKPTGLVSGEIRNANNLISSLFSSQKNFYDSNINFNPQCDEVSRSNHYMAPSIAVRASDVGRLLSAQTVEGKIDVTKVTHTSANILVGNSVNPTNIIFCHYDSIETGAVDNASGVALMLKIVIEKPEYLAQNLFVFCGNEELSYDETVYWGHGYRVFEKAHSDILRHAIQIVVLDSFGHGPTEVITNSRIVTLAFPVESLEMYKDKIALVAGPYNELMQFYHAENDTPDQIQNNLFLEAEHIVTRTFLSQKK